MKKKETKTNKYIINGKHLITSYPYLTLSYGTGVLPPNTEALRGPNVHR